MALRGHFCAISRATLPAHWPRQPVAVSGSGDAPKEQTSGEPGCESLRYQGQGERHLRSARCCYFSIAPHACCAQTISLKGLKCVLSFSAAGYLASARLITSLNLATKSPWWTCRHRQPLKPASPTAGKSRSAMLNPRPTRERQSSCCSGLARKTLRYCFACVLTWGSG